MFLSLLLLNTAGLVIYGIVLAVYRLVFHPLARFPGPKLTAATKWYEFYHDVLKGHGLFADQIRAMHRAYGPIVRINPDELHVDDPEWYDTLYANNPTKRDKWPPAAKVVGTSYAGFGTVSHDVHAKRRAALSPLFSVKAIANANAVMQDQVRVLLDVFHRKYLSKEVAELRTLFVAFTMDTIHQYATGDSTHLQQDEDRAKWWWLSLAETTKMIPTAKQLPWMVGLGQKAPLGLIRRLKPEMAGLLGIHREMYTRAKQFLAQAKDSQSAMPSDGQAISDLVFRTIRSSNLPIDEKKLDRLAQEAFTVIVAGGETTSRMLESGVFHILSTPLVLKGVQDEAKMFMPDVSKIPSTKMLGEMPYINTVVKEVLRVSALVTSRLPLMAHEELRYKDWIIPQKTPTGMTPHDVLLDSKVFPDPGTFDPERWIRDPSLDRYLVAFGKGTRMCQGMRFAFAELNLVLLTIFRCFNLELYQTTKERDLDYVGDGFLGIRHPDSPGVRIKVIGLRV